jgi:hypothetical protein
VPPSILAPTWFVQAPGSIADELIVNPNAAGGEELGGLTTRDYIGHRKIRVVLTDQEAASLLAFAFAGRAEPDAGDDLPDVVRRRAAKVAMRKLLMSRERTRVRFWNQVHVGHVELAGLDKTHRPQLGRQKVHVTLTVEQVHALHTYGAAGRERFLEREPRSHPDIGACDATEVSLEKLRHAIDGVVERHWKATGHREWFWGSCKNPLTWLVEKIARDTLETAANHCIVER